MQELDDIALLHEYAVRGSEEAFATLVTRHVNKVYSVALRHTRNPHQAEEITQAVFVILARKAGHLGKRVILEGWLHQTARLTALTSLRGESRRAHREQEACMRTLANEDESKIWEQIAPLLDTAIVSLNETDRHAVVLRFIYNKSMKEVGAVLGASESAATVRLHRALEKLRKFFIKHGVSSTGAIIAAAISANSVQAAPSLLAKSITTVALTKGVVGGGSTLTLMKGTLKLMAWTKAKIAIVSGVAVLLVAVTATTITLKVLTGQSVPLKVAYVHLYSGHDYSGHLLTILPMASDSTNTSLLRGDLDNFDGVPSDDGVVDNFNDKTASISYLLPKGKSVVLFEHAHFDGPQFKLVGTGKPEEIPDFDGTHPEFAGGVSSLRWVQ